MNIRQKNEFLKPAKQNGSVRLYAKVWLTEYTEQKVEEARQFLQHSNSLAGQVQTKTGVHRLG